MLSTVPLNKKYVDLGSGVKFCIYMWILVVECNFVYKLI